MRKYKFDLEMVSGNVFSIKKSANTLDEALAYISKLIRNRDTVTSDTSVINMSNVEYVEFKEVVYE